MKCMYCGAELREDSRFCSICGKEVQIVPDYTVLEDDYLKAILEGTDASSVPTQQEETKKANKQKELQQKKEQQKKEKQKKLIILISVAVLLVAILLIIGIKISIDKHNASSCDYQTKQAQKALSEGNTDEAAMYYENALALSPENKDVRLKLAKLYMAEQDYDAAMILYLEVIKLDNTNEEAYRNLISIYETKEDTDAIVKLCEEVTDPDILELFQEYMVTPPVFNYDSDTYEEYIDVELSAAEGYEIYYTTDKSNPISSKGILYEKPIALDDTKDYEIRAVCVNEKGIYSEIVTKNYTINLPAPDMPTVTPNGGNYTEETLVTVEVPSGCTAYYTWDGTDPNITSAVYTEPFPVPEGNNVLSVLLIDNKTEKLSSIYRQYYTYYPAE